MNKNKLVSDLTNQILNEIEGLVQTFFKSITQEKLENVKLESKIREIVLQVGSKIYEKSVDLKNGGKTDKEIPCGCGSSKKFTRYDERPVETSVGTTRIKVAYYYCKVCHKGEYPIYKELGLDNKGTSEGLRRMVSMIGAEIPYNSEVGMKILEELTGVFMNPVKIERISEQVGQEIKEIQEVEVQDEIKELEVGQLKGEGNIKEGIFIGMCDGATVRTADGFKEVKTGAFYKIEGGQESERKYVSTFDKIGNFSKKFYARAVKEGVWGYKEKVFLGDGSEWIWSMIDNFFPESIKILDYWHLVEHLWKVANEKWGEGTVRAKKWVKKRKRELLKKNGKYLVLERLEDLLKKTEQEGIRYIIEEVVNYIRKNFSKMDYYRYKKCGYPIGSGVVESACKRIVKARFKQAGMTWNVEHAERLLQVRVSIKNGEFEKYRDLFREKVYQKVA